MIVRAHANLWRRGSRTQNHVNVPLLFNVLYKSAPFSWPQPYSRPLSTCTVGLSPAVYCRSHVAPRALSHTYLRWDTASTPSLRPPCLSPVPVKSLWFTCTRGKTCQFNSFPTAFSPIRFDNITQRRMLASNTFRSCLDNNNSRCGTDADERNDDTELNELEDGEDEDKPTEIVLHESDLEEQFVRGSGPGGQKINKSSVCVVR